MSNLNWVKCTVQAWSQPANAVIGGVDSDGSQIYVGRAVHECDILAAKIIPAKSVAYVAYGGQEISKDTFEVLTGKGFEWVEGQNGTIPQYAVKTGTTACGDTLFVGRVHHDEVVTVGKVHPSHGCCYFPYGGSERSSKSYDVLVQKPLFRWVPFNVNCSIMDDAVEVGVDQDGHTVFVGRTHIDDNLIPASVIPEKQVIYVPHSGAAQSVHRCQVLCGSKLSWVEFPPGYIPVNAVIGGHTTKEETLYIGRTGWGGHWNLGKINPNQNGIYFPYDGQELMLWNYEMLVALEHEGHCEQK